MKQYRRYFPRVRIRSTVFIFVTVLITSLYNGSLKCFVILSTLYVWLVWNNADVEINFIIQLYLFIIYWTIVDSYMYTVYVPLSLARQNKESEKGLFNTNKQKTNTRTYVNQRDDMLTKTLNNYLMSVYYLHCFSLITDWY
jgi:hypothetical protein